MAEPGIIRETSYTSSDRARNDRIASTGRNGGRSTRRAVQNMLDGIDFGNLTLTPHNNIGVKYNRYPVMAEGGEYELQLLQPIARTTKRYDMSLIGGEEVRYLDSIDLSSMTATQAKAYIAREMADYIRRNNRR